MVIDEGGGAPVPRNHGNDVQMEDKYTRGLEVVVSRERAAFSGVLIAAPARFERITISLGCGSSTLQPRRGCHHFDT